MNKHIVATVGWSIVAFSLLGCTHPKPVTASTPIVISIAADGALAVDGRRCAWSELADKLQSEAYRKSTGVTIRADRKTRFSDILAALEACKIAGISVRTTTDG
jgi:biopolymer transport protein ExbD